MSKIAFIGNPTSISYLISKELISRGHEVDIISNGSIFQTNKFSSKKPNIIQRAIRKYSKPLYHAIYQPGTYDIELRSFSKPIVKAKHRAIVYHGSDLRDNLWPVEYPCFYTTVELGLLYLDLKKNAVWLPRCIYAGIFKPVERIPFDGKHLIVGHFPTDPKMEEKGFQGKGSRYLYAAIDVLKERGYAVELLTPEKIGHVSHDEMPALYKRCHVIADQFVVGQYGVISLEAILCNRPVVCYVPDRHWEYQEMKSQIVNCIQDPSSIADALLKAIDHPVNPDLIKELYSPKRSTDVMEKALRSWGFLN